MRKYAAQFPTNDWSTQSCTSSAGPERLFLVADHLAGAHPGILFVTDSAFLRFGPDAYSVKTASAGGALEELLMQLPVVSRQRSVAVSA